MNEFHHPLRAARNTRSCVSCTQYKCFLEETGPKWMNVPTCVCHCCFFQIQSEFNYKLWVSLFIREVSPKKFGVYLSKIFGRLSVANIQNAKMRPITSIHNEKSKCDKEIYQMRYDTVLVLLGRFGLRKVHAMAMYFKSRLPKFTFFLGFEKNHLN